ncbi:MAG TPA: PAS domain S-box protein [Smithellaceae bacterium]|nr:PAS domain S-box protein [Smithellaceae bacterium]
MSIPAYKSDNAHTNWLRDGDFKQMVEDLQVMVCVYDINGFIYLNPAAKNVTGYFLEEIRHRKFWELVHEDDRNWIKERGTARLFGEKVPTTREFRIVKKNGEVMWINVFYLITTWSGRNVNILGFIDITENKRLNEELRASRSELEARVNKEPGN